MEVRNVNSAQNFGMALRIKPGAADALRKWNENKLERLAKLGEELKDHKHVDVIVDEAGQFVLDLKNCANKYRNIDIQPDNMEKSFINLRGTWAGSEASGTVPGTRVSHSFQLRTPEAAQELIKKTTSKQYYDEIEKIGTIAKAFEDRGVWQAEKAAAERARTERVNSAVDSLMSNFGAEA